MQKSFDEEENVKGHIWIEKKHVVALEYSDNTWVFDYMVVIFPNYA